jgi:uncharacterized protein (DUF1778 family)
MVTSSKKSARIKQPRDLVRVITRFERDLLQRVDAAAADQGLNRTAFVLNAVAERLRVLKAAR